MWRVALKGVLGRKVRLVLTALAVVLGVAFFSGTRVFTDTILRAFDDLFTEANAGIDGQVRAAQSVDDPFGNEQRGQVPEDVVDVVRDTEGIAEAHGNVQGFAYVVGRDGKAVNREVNGPPALGFAWTDSAVLNPLRLVDGAAPTGPADVVVDRSTADDNGFEVGDTIRIETAEAGTGEYHLSGIVTFGDADSPLGATISAFEKETAQRLLGASDAFDSIEYVASSDVAETVLRDRVLEALVAAGHESVTFAVDPVPESADLQVLTGDELREETEDDLRAQLSFFTTFLFVFVIVALVVSAFVIYNSFSITIAQRRREMGLLRAIGARRRQVLGAVLIEALATGVVASLVGFLCGVGLAVALQAGLRALEIDVPSTSPVVSTSTLVSSLLLGLLVTLVASLAPAWRASGIPPIAALRDVTVTNETSTTWRLLRAAAVLLVGVLATLTAVAGSSDRGFALARSAVLVALGAALFTRRVSDVSVYRLVRASVVLVLGVLTISQGLFGSSDNGLPLVGAGAFVVFVGVALFSSLIARPVASVMGRPAVGVVVMASGALMLLGGAVLVVSGLVDASPGVVAAGVVVALFAWAYVRSGIAAFGMTGRLGRENAMRNPLRTGRTSSALMIGIGLVAFITVFAASARAAITDIIGEQVRADFVVNAGFGPSGLSPDLARQLREVPGVQSADGVRGGVVTSYEPGKDPGDEPVRFISAVDPSTSDELWNLGFVEGASADLGLGQVAVWNDRADDLGLEVGDEIALGFVDTGRTSLEVVAIYEHNELAGDFVVSLETWEANVERQFDFIIAIKAEAGVDLDPLRERVERVVDDYPTATLESREEFESSQADQINGFLNLVYGLLLFAIIISAFGIANTLALSIFERTRELGLLRAVGMNRSQVRRMIRWESVIVALLGTALGVVIGVFFSWLMIQALDEQGFDRFAVPYTQVFLVLVFGAGVGIVSALLPAYRAARLDMLAAISSE